MLFIVLSVIAGFVLMVAAVYSCRRFRKEWSMPRGLYLRAGMALIMLEIFHFAMMDGVINMWPEFENLDLLLQALIIGTVMGIFFEFGRFMFLDKLFKGVRLEKEGLYFALGWNGVATFLIGFLIALGSVGMYILISTDDLSGYFAGANSEEMEQALIMQEEIKDLTTSYSFIGLSPLIERGALLVLDMALTLLILLYFMGGSSIVVWQAAFVRAISMAAIYAASKVNLYLGELLFIIVGIVAYLLLRKVRTYYNGSYSLKINGT